MYLRFYMHCFFIHLDFRESDMKRDETVPGLFVEGMIKFLPFVNTKCNVLFMYQYNGSISGRV